MSAIYQQPLVADLLISLAAMAASNPNQKHRQRFFACPYPPSDFVCQKIRSASAANADDNMGIQWTELIKVNLVFDTVYINHCCSFASQGPEQHAVVNANSPLILCMNPPSVVHPPRLCTLMMCTAFLFQVLSDLPTVAKMAAAKNLKRFLDKHDPRAFRLVSCQSMPAVNLPFALNPHWFPDNVLPELQAYVLLRRAFQHCLLHTVCIACNHILT